MNAGLRLCEIAPDRYGGFVKYQIKLMRCKDNKTDSAALIYNVPVWLLRVLSKVWSWTLEQTGSQRETLSSRCCFFNLEAYKNSLKLKFCFVKDGRMRNEPRTNQLHLKKFQGHAVSTLLVIHLQMQHLQPCFHSIQWLITATKLMWSLLWTHSTSSLTQ